MKENISEHELKLHKKFERYDELTTITRYIIIFLLGIYLTNFGVNIYLFVLLLSLLLNGFFYYSMKHKLEEIINERYEFNYGNKKEEDI